MQSIENNIINRIYGKGRGWAFFKNDFLDLGYTAAVNQALSRLQKNQRIRRVMRGIYDYPKFNKLLNEKSRARILKDTRYTTTWVYEGIKRTFIDQ
ncbi:MAG: DUF6088 family protein [Xanthomonadales bacterium]|nr:DUF6088 family protein [Xanthomonadales bacterium]